MNYKLQSRTKFMHIKEDESNLFWDLADVLFSLFPKSIMRKLRDEITHHGGKEFRKCEVNFRSLNTKSQK